MQFMLIAPDNALIAGLKTDIERIIMKWTHEAEEAIKKVPFFVRRKVRERVEKEARDRNKTGVTLAEVNATRKRYLTGMASEVKGYQLDACFGPSGCPNRLAPDAGITEKVERIIKKADMLGFLKSQGVSDLKFHHEFRISVAECPNACSQPQIKDIGIIAAKTPHIGAPECTACEACVDVCREDAITLGGDPCLPAVDMRRCLACGQCISVCPTGTITDGVSGYRVQLGGKLGRHPRLAWELPGIYSTRATLEIVSAAIAIYKAGSRGGERFGEVLKARDVRDLDARFGWRALDKR
jgi:anaerobic sulfite reductase subunit C